MDLRVGNMCSASHTRKCLYVVSIKTGKYRLVFTQLLSCRLMSSHSYYMYSQRMIYHDFCRALLIIHWQLIIFTLRPRNSTIVCKSWNEPFFSRKNFVIFGFSRPNFFSCQFLERKKNIFCFSVVMSYWIVKSIQSLPQNKTVKHFNERLKPKISIPSVTLSIILICLISY